MDRLLQMRLLLLAWLDWQLIKQTQKWLLIITSKLRSDGSALGFVGRATLIELMMWLPVWWIVAMPVEDPKLPAVLKVSVTVQKEGKVYEMLHLLCAGVRRFQQLEY